MYVCDRRPCLSVPYSRTHTPSPNPKQSHIKLESYGFAISDATKAIQLDPAYIKAYYRRAIAHVAIAKHKDALRDFRAVCKRGWFVCSIPTLSRQG